MKMNSEKLMEEIKENKGKVDWFGKPYTNCCLKEKQSERLNCYREELRFLEVKMFDFMNINGTCFRIMSDRINFLKKEIKILEGREE